MINPPCVRTRTGRGIIDTAGITHPVKGTSAVAIAYKAFRATVYPFVNFRYGQSGCFTEDVQDDVVQSLSSICLCITLSTSPSMKRHILGCFPAIFDFLQDKTAPLPHVSRI